MGIEVNDPIINEETFALNFTNEGGIEGTTRFLKNIAGMWLLEQCLKDWKNEGITYAYENWFNDGSVFLLFNRLLIQTILHLPIRFVCRPQSPIIAGQRHQIVPSTDGEFVRCIFESLSLKYNYVLGKTQRFVSFFN